MGFIHKSIIILESIRTKLANIDSRQMSSQFVSPFSKDEVSRYSRQMMMPEIGAEGQLRIKNTSVLIVGCGGLGCPSSIYLAAAGIGRIGLIDNDVVEINNLHRQILHKVSTIGQLKTDSAQQSLEGLNPEVKYEKHNVKIDRQNAVSIIENYDIVVDATDNLIARYLINDACVVANKPLVSGAALRFEGQLTVYNYAEDTPCFRCLFPLPPPADTIRNCSDTGVVGVIPGIIGSLQALETIKIAAGLKPAYAGRMLLFDGQVGTFRNIQLNKKRKDCVACGEQSNLSNPADKIGRDLIDYEKFCSTPICHGEVRILESDERISVEEYNEMLKEPNKRPHILIDVRPELHTSVSKLAHAIAIPLAQLEKPANIELVKDALAQKETNEIIVMCRKGIASQSAVRILQDIFEGNEKSLMIKDVKGGMTAWSNTIDPSVPVL